MLHCYTNQFLEYCRLVDFSIRSTQTLTTRLNELENFLKTHRIRFVKRTGFSFPEVGRLGVTSFPSRMLYEQEAHLPVLHLPPWTSALWSAKTSECFSQVCSLFAIRP